MAAETDNRQGLGPGDVVARVGSGRDHGQLGEIAAVLGSEGHERYLVRWETGRETICYTRQAAGLELRRRATK